MHPLFHIDTADIQRLNDVQARELVARLCNADVIGHGASTAAVTWGGDQRAKDGGVDVRVDIDPPVGIRGYVKNDRCAFQVKAEKFPPGKIPGEMAPKGKLRPAFEDLAMTGGAYIIVSTRDDFADGALKARRTAMTQCLTSHGKTGKVEIDFYDARKIANWVEQHAAIVVWVKKVLGRQLNGWQPYAAWAYGEVDVDAEYLIDDRVKILLPDSDEGIDIRTAIDRLRSDLSKNVSVRIVGLSGVGKTRLVQALFDPRIKTPARVLDAENVIYTDLSDNPTPQPSEMVEALVSERSQCTLVVDNCGQETHGKLTEIAKRPGSRLRLITIEYDIRDDLPEGTRCYQLDGSSDEVVKELLRRRYAFLSYNDLDKIAEFSDGNARVAFALAATGESTGALARLRDSELFERLFHQKNTRSDQLLRAAEVVSLQYSFDGEDMSDGSELAGLASLAELSVSSLTRHIAELRRRGLIQARGKWRAVLPHAIANRLAARALESLPPEGVLKVLSENASERVARSFSRRLGYLHESQAVREIVRAWLPKDGRYGDLTKATELGREIFSNVAPVHPEAALAALERGIQSDEFVSTEHRGRGRFIRLTRSLAYDSELFDRAVGVLLRFALAEPVDYNYEPARDVLKSLFRAHLSGTEARSEQRAKIVRDLLWSNGDQRQSLGLALLDAALEAWSFTSYLGFEFGARKRGFGWSPRTREDVKSWYSPFIDIAVEAGRSKSDTGRQSRVILGESLRGLWVRAGLRGEIRSAANALMAVDSWPEGWLGTRRVLRWDRGRIDANSLEDLQRLEEELAPKDLAAKIAAKILARGSFASDVELAKDDGNPAGVAYRRSETEAEELGQIAALDQALVLELLPKLLKTSNARVRRFGLGLGQELADVPALLTRARELIANAKPGSISLLLIRGLISGWQTVSPQTISSFLDDALYDEVWSNWFVELQVCVDLGEVAFERILKSLELGTTPVWQYQYLGMGRSTDPLSVVQISQFIDKLMKRSKDDPSVVIDLLAMVVHCAKEKDLEYQHKLSRFCTEFLRKMDWSLVNEDNSGSNHDIIEIIDFALATAQSENLVNGTLQSMLSGRDDSPRTHARELGQWLTPFFKHYPALALNAVHRPDNNGKYRKMINRVSTLDDEQETAIGSVPIEKLLEWCEISPQDRYLFAAGTCQLFAKGGDATGGDSAALAISDAAKRVLAGAPDKSAVLAIYIDRFRPSGWSGSLAQTMKERLPLLGQLRAVADAKLGSAITIAAKDLEERIAIIEAGEAAEERERTGSFE
jgi:hypothetical protein